MVLIKRVMLAAAMSLLSEGAIAGAMPAAPSDMTPRAELPQDRDRAGPGETGVDTNR